MRSPQTILLDQKLLSYATQIKTPKKQGESTETERKMGEPGSTKNRKRDVQGKKVYREGGRGHKKYNI